MRFLWFPHIVLQFIFVGSNTEVPNFMPYNNFFYKQKTTLIKGLDHKHSRTPSNKSEFITLFIGIITLINRIFTERKLICDLCSYTVLYEKTEKAFVPSSSVFCYSDSHIILIIREDCCEHWFEMKLSWA